MAVLAWVEARLQAQRGHLFPWAPVCLASGIGTYFALSFEPGPGAYCGALALCGAGLALGRLNRGGWAVLGWALALAAAGFALAGLRAHRVAAPVLEGRYYGAVEGRVVAIDRSASDAVRVTLDRVRLPQRAGRAPPDRVRIALHGGGAVPQPGDHVMTTAHLAGPAGPVEPGGFDFRRHAWFQGLGAVGYARVPLLRAGPGGDTEGLGLVALRMALSARIRAALPGDVGGFAAAVTTGDRSGVSQAALAALRASNLAHLLAISGLHMGLLAGFVFALVRGGLALVPPVALRWPLRKIAAAVALVAASGYLALSGGNVATERAYVMAAVMLGAVLVDRRALSLRAVACAALIVLALRPETLLGPGFQMSFAATVALVAVFGALRDREIWLRGGVWGRIAGLVLSSAVAGFATAPIAAAHFNVISHYGLAANLVSVPVMGMLVIPAAVLALILAPLGGAQLGLWLMGAGLAWILRVAETVAALPGARGFVPGPGGWVLPLLALGALWLVLWQGRARWAGLAPAALALQFWGQVERPLVLVAETGTLVGVMTDAGRALSKARGSGFVAAVWLENDGDPADQATAAGRWQPPKGAPAEFAFLQVADLAALPPGARPERSARAFPPEGTSLPAGAGGGDRAGRADASGGPSGASPGASSGASSAEPSGAPSRERIGSPSGNPTGRPFARAGLPVRPGAAAEAAMGADMSAEPVRQPWQILHVTGQRAARELTGCHAGQIVISQVPLPDLTGDCLLFDPPRLTRTGSLAIGRDGIRYARAAAGQRLWNRMSPPPPGAGRWPGAGPRPDGQ